MTANPDTTSPSWRLDDNFKFADRADGIPFLNLALHLWMYNRFVLLGSPEKDQHDESSFLGTPRSGSLQSICGSFSERGHTDRAWRHPDCNRAAWPGLRTKNGPES